jgi:hypothetical protein
VVLPHSSCRRSNGDVDAGGFATGSTTGLANSRDGCIPTKRNSAIASNEARKAKMSERALKVLRGRVPSKLKVSGSNPGGIADEIKPLASIGLPKKLQIGGAGRIETFVPEKVSHPAALEAVGLTSRILQRPFGRALSALGDLRGLRGVQPPLSGVAAAASFFDIARSHVPMPHRKLWLVAQRVPVKITFVDPGEAIRWISPGVFVPTSWSANSMT